VEVQEYHLKWDITATPDGKMYITQQGLIFKCDAFVYLHPFWSYYVNVSHVLDAKYNEHLMPLTQGFYSQKLANIPNVTVQYTQKEYKYDKMSFSRYKMYYYMPIVSKEEMDLFESIEIPNRLIVDSYNANLLLSRNLYMDLPEVWTMQDIYKLNNVYYDQEKEPQEMLWYTIALARKNNMPVTIPLSTHEYIEHSVLEL